MYTDVISVRVRRELKLEAERLGINIKEVVEKALIAEIEKAKRRKMENAIEKILKNMSMVSRDDWVEVVRQCRRGR